MGFWPEDRWDYSPEADAIRAKLKRERELYEQNRKKDPIAEAAISILKNKSYHKPKINQPLYVDTLDQIIQEKTK